MPPLAEELFLITQPGWAFATLAELHSWGVAGYVSFRHRDSSLNLLDGTPPSPVISPADTVPRFWPLFKPARLDAAY